jgi:hypothetical protein
MKVMFPATRSIGIGFSWPLTRQLCLLPYVGDIGTEYGLLVRSGRMVWSGH